MHVGLQERKSMKGLSKAQTAWVTFCKKNTVFPRYPFYHVWRMDFRAHPLLVMTLTNAHLYLMVFSLPICPPPAPLLQLPNIPTPPDSGKKCHDPKASLEKCFDPRCSERNSSQTCEGIVSCYWCVYNKDSVPLKKSYCATAEACFRGKEGLTILCLSINVLVWYLNRK